MTAEEIRALRPNAKGQEHVESKDIVDFTNVKWDQETPPCVRFDPEHKVGFPRDGARNYAVVARHTCGDVMFWYATRPEVWDSDLWSFVAAYRLAGSSDFGTLYTKFIHSHSDCRCSTYPIDDESVEYKRFPVVNWRHGVPKYVRFPDVDTFGFPKIEGVNLYAVVARRKASERVAFGYVKEPDFDHPSWNFVAAYEMHLITTHGTLVPRRPRQDENRMGSFRHGDVWTWKNSKRWPLDERHVLTLCSFDGNRSVCWKDTGSIAGRVVQIDGDDVLVSMGNDRHLRHASEFGGPEFWPEADEVLHTSARYSVGSLKAPIGIAPVSEDDLNEAIAHKIVGNDYPDHDRDRKARQTSELLAQAKQDLDGWTKDRRERAERNARMLRGEEPADAFQANKPVGATWERWPW